MKNKLLLKILLCAGLIWSLFNPALCQLPGDSAPALIMGPGGYPSNMIEVAPTRKTAFEIFPPGRRCVWVAVKMTSVGPTGWGWKKYGPYDFKGGTRYYSHIGQIDYTVAPDYDARYSRLGPGDTALSFENIYGDKWVAFVIGDLLNSATTGSPSHGSAFTNETAWIVNQTPIPWVFHANGVVDCAGQWSGSWRAAGGNTVVVNMKMLNSAATDRFEVRFNPDGRGFTAYQNGAPFRTGVRSQSTPAPAGVVDNAAYPNATGTWDGTGGDCDNGGRYVVQVTTSGETFHATCSYTSQGKPYSWTMDGKIDPQGKVDAIMNHSYAGKMPAAFQLSKDGKRVSGGTWNWVRR